MNARELNLPIKVGAALDSAGWGELEMTGSSATPLWATALEHDVAAVLGPYDIESAWATVNNNMGASNEAQRGYVSLVVIGGDRIVSASATGPMDGPGTSKVEVHNRADVNRVALEREGRKLGAIIGFRDGTEATIPAAAAENQTRASLRDQIAQLANEFPEA